MTKSQLREKVETLVNIATANIARPVSLELVLRVCDLQKEILEQIDRIYPSDADHPSDEDGSDDRPEEAAEMCSYCGKSLKEIRPEDMLHHANGDCE